MDRVNSKFQKNLWPKNVCVKVAYFIMCRNRLKLRDSHNEEEGEDGERDEKIV